MPDAVSGTSGAGMTYTAPTSSVDRPDQMGKDVFLKLLVAQMRYQDPSKPVDSSQMMSQTATFTQVEKLEQLATQNASLLALQRSTSAGALVGRTVTYTSSTGASVSGVATSVRLGSDNSEAVVMVGGVQVPMGRVTEIAQTPPAAGTSTTGS
jgi:flagellar basal-body rod modification protein FlgD